MALFSLEIKTMADSPTIELAASARAGSGKGPARQVRREGRVPGVIYGDNQAPEAITMEFNELFKQFLKGQFTSNLISVNIDGRKVFVLPRDVQLDPVKDLPLHVDFQRVSATSRVRVAVPVHFINEGLSPGLKRGGVLNIVRHEIEVTCPAQAIPKFFEVNLEGLEIGRSVHISAVKLPDGVRPTITDRDFTICSVAGAKKEEEVEVATTTAGEAAPAEGAAAAALAAGGDAKAAPGAAGAKAPAAKADAKAGGDAKKK